MTSRRSFIEKMGVGLVAAPTIIKNLRIETPGITIGTITYSFRDMPAQDADSILQYVLATGVRSIELMGDPAEVFAGKPKSTADFRAALPALRKRFEKQELNADEQKIAAEFDKQMAADRSAAAIWRKSASMGKFEELKKKFKSAGVSIYGFKPDCFGMQNSDEEIQYGMSAAKALGANQVTLEHPSNDAHTLKLGSIASKYGIRVGYHGHEQQTPSFWDTALGQSNSNAINLDLGHFVAAGNKDPLGFIRQKNSRISSMHIKDRQNPEHGKGNLVWGSGDTPIAEALKLMRDEKYKFPATIELEYAVPADSDAVKEVKKCLEFCKNALATK